MFTTKECDKPTETSQCFSVFIAFFQLTYRILFFAVCKYVCMYVVFTNIPHSVYSLSVQLSYIIKQFTIESVLGKR